jgi:protein TonB
MMPAPSSRWTTHRIVGAGFVGLLHIVAIYALVVGLAPKIFKVIEQPIQMIDLMQQQPKTQDVPKPKLPDVPAPSLDAAVPLPRIDIATDTALQIHVSATPQPPQSVAPDTAPSSISSTHTTPPYPGVARKLGEQGTVKLKLTISPQGVVTAVDVVQTSGFPDLDQTAVYWVMSNWRYRPAVQGGVAVAGTALAAVVFSLKNAG